MVQIDPWPAESTVSSSVFWDEKNDLSVGAFIDGVAFWDDTEYAIWHSTGKLAIRFYYKEKVLSYKYPVYSGTRSSSISVYEHKKDIQLMNDSEYKYHKIKHPKGFNYGARISQLTYNSFLQNRYSTIDLNKVKDWDLGYADSLSLSPVIFDQIEINTIDELEQRFISDSARLQRVPFYSSSYQPAERNSDYQFRSFKVRLGIPIKALYVYLIRNSLYNQNA